MPRQLGQLPSPLQTVSHLDTAVQVIENLGQFLQEAHQEEIDQRHYGERASDCSYCAAIKQADRFIKNYNKLYGAHYVRVGGARM